MDDGEFLAAFEAGRLRSFTHRDHLRMARQPQVVARDEIDAIREGNDPSLSSAGRNLRELVTELPIE